MSFSGDSPITEEQPKHDALSSLLQLDDTNSIEEAEKLVPSEVNDRKNDRNLASEDQKLMGSSNIHESEETISGTIVGGKIAEEVIGEKAIEKLEIINPLDSMAEVPLEKVGTDTGKPPNTKEPKISDDPTDNVKAEVKSVSNSHQSQEQSSDVETGEKPHNGEVPVSAAFGGSDSALDPNYGDANVDILPDIEPMKKRSIDSDSEPEATSGSVQDNIDRMKERSKGDTKDLLLEMCNSQPSLPECDQLRGAKIYRGKKEKSKEPVKDEEIGRLERAWRNLMKIMKRIKLMKLGFVRLFHGPLSVMGLEDVSLSKCTL